jgi:hypothetical protein
VSANGGFAEAICLIRTLPILIHLYGPAVRCTRTLFRVGGERSCINLSGLCWSVNSWPSWISARVRSHCATGLNGPFGSPVFARAGKTEPRSRLILSQIWQVTVNSSRRLSGRRNDWRRFKCSTTSQNAPGDAGQLVGERDRKDIAVQPLPGRGRRKTHHS